jgi:hypothetical protein
MANVLSVPALQFGYPVALLVLSKADNPAVHKDFWIITVSVRLRNIASFHP